MQLRSIVWAFSFKNFCMRYCNYWLTMFVCAITIDIFYGLLNLISCLHLWNLQLSYLIMFFIDYYNWDLLYERLHLRTFVCIIAIFDWQCSINILYALLNLISCLHLWNLKLLYLLLFLWLVYTVYTVTIVKFLLCTMLSTFKMT